MIAINKIKKKSFGCLGLLAVLLLLAMPVYGAQPDITYFNANDPNKSCLYGFIKSTSPIRDSDSTFSIFQRGNLHGAVVMSLSALGALHDVSAGFSIYNVGKLADIKTITITADPDSFSVSGTASFSLNLWLDVSGTGEYFVWSDNYLTGLGTTVYGLGPGGTSNVLTVTGTTTFFLSNYAGPPWTATLADLKAGNVPGINPADTNVAIWVGFYIGGGTTGSGNAVIPPPGISIS